MDIFIAFSFIIYFLILLGIGVFFYKKSKSERSYIIGNRSLNFWVTAISAQSSDMGGWLFLGYPAMIYSFGLLESWTAVGLVFFMYLNWYFIAPKIRASTEHYKSLTLSSYFASRFNDNTGQIKIVSALISLVFFTFYIASGLVSLGRLFESAFSIDYLTGVILGISVTVIYTVVGGFLAVSWCNLFQGLFLLAMIILVPIAAFLKVGGLAPIVAAAHAKNISLSLFPSFTSIGKILLLTGGFGLGYFGQPHILVNFMGIDDVRNMKKAALVGIIWQILVLTAAIFIGIVGIAYFGNTLISPEHIFPTMAKELFSSVVAGFALCGVLAATLSSINTQILVSASNLAEDIYKEIINTDASSKKMLWASRMSTIVVAAIALIISLKNNESIYNLVQYAWSGLGSAFGPLLILSLYSKKPNASGALAGMLVGGFISAFWPYLNTNIPSLIPGFFLSLISIYIVSYLYIKKLN